ncbi:MAG: dihydroneopterin aldolase [Hyphomonadaceae bacterium]|jgi:dihydroneopterin aldolase|nr:dihydroneopterin aldolase [Hyphomonadaceae bacterium]
MRSTGPTELGLVARPGQGWRRQRSAAGGGADQGTDAAIAHVATQARQTRIFVEGLMVEAECGVYAHEKGSRRPLVVDIDVAVDPGTVRSTDDALAETVDYDGLVAVVREIANGAHLHLIETFAEQIASRLLADQRIVEVRLRVEKPGAVPGARCSGVEVTRVRA